VFIPYAGEFPGLALELGRNPGVASCQRARVWVFGRGLCVGSRPRAGWGLLFNPPALHFLNLFALLRAAWPSVPLSLIPVSIPFRVPSSRNRFRYMGPSTSPAAFAIITLGMRDFMTTLP